VSAAVARLFSSSAATLLSSLSSRVADKAGAASAAAVLTSTLSPTESSPPFFSIAPASRLVRSLS
jgi:hypothetical protein